MRASLAEGRKYTMSLFGVAAVTVLALCGADSASFGAVAVIVGAYCGGNAVVEWKHAGGTRGD